LKYLEGRLGRVFVIRLEEGDIVPDCIEEFAGNKNISIAHVSLLDEKTSFTLLNLG